MVRLADHPVSQIEHFCPGIIGWLPTITILILFAPASRSGNQGRYPNRPLLHSNPALLVILPPSSMKKCPITDVSVPLITFKIPPRLRSDREREKGRSSPL